jgi:hypothetical protein
MSVDISVGDAALTTGNVAPWSWTTAVENVTIGAASANNRKDVVVAYVDLSVTNPSTATPNNPGALKFKVVQGTPATVPSAPFEDAIGTSVGAGNPFIVLAIVSLTPSTTQITNAQITNVNNPIALQNVRLWGGSNNTLGHLVPNVADGTIVTTSDTGSVSNSMLAANSAWSSFAPAAAGFSSKIADVGRRQQIGKTMFASVLIDGMSNSNSFSFTLPAPAKANEIIAGMRVADNGSFQNTTGMIELTAGSSTAVVHKTNTSGATAWTASNAKAFYNLFFYETA